MREPRVHLFPSRPAVVVAALSLATVAALAAPAHAVTYTVDCAAGQTIGAALVAARTTFDPVTIVVKGMCKERVVIDRDEVTLRGKDAASGIDGAGVAGTSPLIIVSDAHRIFIDNVRLLPAGTGGLRLTTGASARAQRLLVDGADFGISLYPDTSLELTSSEVARATGTGIDARGASLVMRASAVYEAKSTGVSFQGGMVELYDSKVTDNGYVGLAATDNAAARVYSTSITNNIVGVFLRTGARVSLGSGAVVADNESEGVRVWDSSTLMLSANATIADNGADGVHVIGGSEVVLLNATIKGNRGNGVEARDTSLVKVSAGVNPTVTGNTSWGVVCEGFPGDARLSSPGLGVAAVFGNGAGQINCPGYVIP